MFTIFQSVLVSEVIFQIVLILKDSAHVLLKLIFIAL